MHRCRVAWQAFSSRLAQGARTTTPPVLRGQVPLRQMSSGSVPGSSGENLIYYLFVIGAAGAGGFYAYRTVTSDKARYNERIEDIQRKSTAEWKPKPWPPQSLESDEMETKEVAEASAEAKPEATEESEATVTDKSEVQNEGPTESAEAEKGEESPVEETPSAVQEEEQDANASSEADQAKG